jgi:tetratricopeptide (TPR) repeat protein
MAHSRELALQRRMSALMAAGDVAGAVTAAAAYRREFPANPLGWILGSVLLLTQDDAPSALRLVDDFLAQHPTEFGAHLQRAECLFALRRRTEAIAAADAAAALTPGDPGALDAVATFLVFAADQQRALGYLDAAVALAPKARDIRVRRAMVRRYVGEFALADDDYALLLAANPTDAEVLKARGELPTAPATNETISHLEASLAQEGIKAEDRIGLYFALAKACEETGDYRASWRHLRAGNNLKRASLSYRSANDSQVIERIITSFGPASPWPTTRCDESPIFIVGLPRTGTTLVDRTLGSHSMVHSAGELGALTEAVTQAVRHIKPDGELDFVEFASLIATADPELISREYLERARPWRGQKPRFTDKQPPNFFYCGVIRRAFPAARLVHVTRHPLAAAHAIYKTLFNNAYPFAYDLTEIADFMIGYRRLMAHWHALMPGQIVDVAYEDMVTDQEATTRRLLDFCGLQFEPQCLEFYRNPASVMTASSVQVRQPLYDSSINRWREFSQELEPVRARLEAAGIAID